MVGIGCIIVVLFRLQVQLVAFFQNQQEHVVKQVAGSGQILEGFLGNAQFFQVGIKFGLSAQFGNGGIQAFRDGGLVSVIQLSAMLFGHQLNGSIEGDSGFSFLPDIFGQSQAVLEFFIPVQAAVIQNDVFIHAVVGIVIDDVVLHGGTKIGHPVQIFLSSNTDTADGHNSLVRRNTGDLIENTGIIVGIISGAVLILAAACEHGQNHDQSQQGTCPLFHNYFPSHF